MLSISRVFSPNAGRVVVDGATSERIPIVSGVLQRSVLSPLLFILYTGEMLSFRSLSTVLRCGVCCCMLSSAFRAPGVFGCQVLP